MYRVIGKPNEVAGELQASAGRAGSSTAHGKRAQSSLCTADGVERDRCACAQALTVLYLARGEISREWVFASKAQRELVAARRRVDSTLPLVPCRDASLRISPGGAPGKPQALSTF